MEQKEISELLERYKQGTCTPEERTKLKKWYDKLAASGEWTWTEEEKARTARAIRHKIHAQINHTRGLRIQPWIWAAASLIIFFIAGIILYKNFEAPVVNNPLAYTETSVPVAQTKKLTLSDGTLVFLNGSSKIRYPEKFNAATREVILEGEAFFDVTHNAQKPFIVRTKNADIRVLGTAFDVRSYASIEDVRVTVARGKVAVMENTAAGQGAGKQVFLLPNEQVSINRHSGDLHKSHVESENIAGWKDGRLIFNNETLGNIAATLQYTRNMTVRFAESDIAGIRCSAGFGRTDSPEDIISALSRANGLSYTIKNNEVSLRKK